MRNPPSSSSITTWQSHKEQGRVHFQNEEYEEALVSYRSALNPEFNCPTAERQILLSNVVACRLKMGGSAQASAAVEDAKQCVALNDNWAKGHVRLASAYIALGGHSNDACNELQKALSLDPGNATARQMLMRELRRDRHPQPAATNDEAQDQQQPEADDAMNVDEPSIPWDERLKFYYMQGVSWWARQSDDTKTLIKVILGLLVLYVAFGGRFGLDQMFGGGTKQNLGNYESGNVYDRYHRQNDAYNYDDYVNAPPRRTSEYNDRYETPPRRTSTTGSSSFHFPNLFDGSPQSMIVLMGIAYLCYRAGINPFHVIMIMNMMGGGRRRGMRMGGFGGMGGMGGYGGMGGGYGGMGRRGFGRPPGGMRF